MDPPSPPGATVLRGNATTYTVTITLTQGSTSIGLPTIAHSVTGLPAGASASFNPQPFQLQSPSAQFTMTVQTGASALGDFPLTVTGTNVDTGFSLSGVAGLHIFDFTVNFKPPNDQKVCRGMSIAYTIAVELTQGSTVIGLPSKCVAECQQQSTDRRDADAESELRSLPDRHQLVQRAVASRHHLNHHAGRLST